MEPKVTGTTPEEREYFTRVMDEAREEREHIQRLAEIEAKQQVDLVRARTRDDSWEHQEWKKHTLISVIVIITILLVGSGIWFITDNVQSSRRAERIKTEEIRQQTAQRCIAEGNIWINNDCLIAAKGVTK